MSKPTSADIPLVRPKQLGLYDAFVDRDAIAREVTPGIPLSERAILRQEEGADTSGHQRAALNREVGEVLETVFQQAKLICGWEVATCILFSIVAQDRSYLRTAPDWILSLFVEEKELLVEVFHEHCDDRRIEPGDSDEDEDSEEG